MVARQLQIEDVSEFKKNYSPSLGEAVSAWSGSAMYGEGTAYFNVLATEGPKGPELDEPQWKASPYYREGMTFEKGLAENQWANNAKLFDERENRNFILGKTSTAQDVLGFMSAFTVGVVEPQNAAVGVGVGMGIGVLAKSGYRAFSLLEKASKAKSIAAQAALGAGEGVAATVITEPLNLYAADRAGSDYDIADSAWNLLTSTAFGAGLRGGGQAYINHMNAKPIQMRQKEIMAAAAEDGKAVAPEQVEAFVAAEQKRDLTIERDTYVKQREETVAKLSEAEQANVRLYDERYGLETNKAAYAYGLDPSDIEIISALETIRTLTPSKVDKSLFSFLRKNGGLRTDSGEFKAMDLRSRDFPGLFNNKKGMQLDDPASRAYQAGLIPDEEVRTLLDTMDEIHRGLKKTNTLDDAGISQAERFLDEQGINAIEYIDNYNKAVPDIDKRIAEIKSTITSPDIISHLRSSIKEVDDILAAFPKDEDLLPDAKALVNTMLGEDEPEMYNQFLTQEDAARLGDEQRLLIDKVDEYQETGQLDELDVAEAESQIETQRAAYNAAQLCLTGS